MRTFYQNIEHKKEQELIQDMQNRKHHDTLLPTQKSPIPLNRYEDMDSSVSGQNITPQSTLNRSTTNYKMVSKALYNFQVITHSSEIRGLCLMKCPSEMRQNLLYFMYKKTHVIFFVFHFVQLHIFTL